MTAPAQPSERRGRWRPSTWAIGIAVLVAVVFLAANAHLLYVALQSQPDCVAHAKPGSAETGRPSAAKSAC